MPPNRSCRSASPFVSAALRRRGSKALGSEQRPLTCREQSPELAGLAAMRLGSISVIGTWLRLREVKEM